MKKRMLSLVMALVITLGLLPMSVLAADTIEISDQAGLAAMAKNAGSYKLTEDITLDSTWSAITPKSGTTFDGNGHTITLNGTPLFNKIERDNVVSNLILNGTVTSDNSVGSLAVISNGTIRNCSSYAGVHYTGNGGSSYAPHYAAGLVGSRNSNSATISNCLYAGTLTVGSAPIYGSIANNQVFVSATISNCIGVGSDRIGSSEGMNSHSAISAGSNTVIADAIDFVPANYVDSLNENLQDGDLVWSVQDCVLAPYGSDSGTTPDVPTDPDATSDEIAALTTAITAAGAVDMTKVYTVESLDAFNEALTAAKAIDTTNSPKQSAATKATSDLTNAQAALVERSTEAVDLTGKTVIKVDQSYFNKYMDNPTTGTYYVLTEDITIGSYGSYWFGSFATFNAVLDGNGHTITLSGSPLYGTIGPNGVIQNLGIKGSAHNSTNDTGALAKECQGLIVNCWSSAAVTSAGYNGMIKNTGGLVANLKSGGAIVNCYVAGSVSASGSTGDGKVGVLAGTAEANTLIKNSYWLNTVGDTTVGNSSGIVTSCAAKTREEAYDGTVTDLLNANKGENNKTWTVNSDGWPHLGEAGNYQPPEPITLSYTKYEGYGSGTISFTDTEGLTLSLAEVLPDPDAEITYYVGQFDYPGFDGEVAFVPQYTANGQGQHKVFASAEGELQVLGAGTLEIAVCDKASWSGTQYETELTRFTVTVSDISAEDIRLIPTGEYVTETNGTYSVAGSGTVTVQAEIKVDGEWKSAPSSLFTFTTSGNVFGTNSSTFYAENPGDITVTASGLNKTASVTITSTYVAVESITPAPSGTYVIHGRDANTDGSGQFLDLMLGHGAGTVIVTPANASYRNAWTLTSSDPTVAEYVDAFSKAVVPYKAGTVTLTATSNDPNLTNQVSGTRNITLSYANPLTAVSFSGDDNFSVQEDASVELPLTFTGTENSGYQYVTEPGMVWSFSGNGKVEISRDGNLGILTGSSDEREYCVANPAYKISGVKEGTVTVTGTPVDTTNSVAPITFTVTVTEGSGDPVDVDKLVSDGIRGAQKYLKANEPDTYAFGYEWTIFSLLRSGETIAQSNIERYLNSVESTYKASPAADSNEMKPTTIARVALALGVLGQDASNFRELNFIKMLCTSDRITEGCNEAIWALIALDSKSYTVSNGTWSNDSLITQILKYQNENGGFGLTDNGTVSVDMTAMALQALAPYCSSNETVKAAVDNALTWLKTQMDSNCVFDGSADSTAQVLVALAALNIDPVDADNGFIKSATKNIIVGISSFQTDSGGFTYNEKINTMTTAQALYALEAYDRYKNEDNALYNLTDVVADAKTKLENRLAEANSLIEGDYTEESWAAMVEARTAAQAVSENATDDEITAADTALANAIAALVKVSGQPGSDDTSNSINAYVTIVNKGEVVVAQMAVSVKDINNSGGFDVDDALYAAHKATYPGGTAAGYSSAKTGYGLSITKLWGDTSGFSGYWLNNTSCWSLADTVKAGDHVVAFVYQSADCSDSYSKFDSFDYTAAADTPCSVTVEKAGYDANWSTVFSDFSGATLTAYDSSFHALSTDSYSVEDNNNGSYSVTFDKAGFYYLTASCDDPLIVPSVCTVTVRASSTSQPEDEDPVVYIRVADPQGTTYCSKTEYVLEDGETAFSLLLKTGLEVASRNSEFGVYVEAIEGLGEFDEGTGSGWMYKVNSEFPEYSSSLYELKDGDYVQWIYTRDLGNDVGGGNSSGSSISTEDTAAAREVKNLIDAIGTVTADSGQAIQAAREAYDKLTDAQKKLVENYDVLTKAEAAYAALTSALPFTDIADHWALEAIQYVYEKDLMNGTSDTRFTPNGTLNRAMLATILYRMEGSPIVTAANPYSDVAADTWYTDAVIWASENGIVNGYGSGKFGPTDNITREQLAAMLLRYSDYKEYDTDARNHLTSYTDAGAISAWALESVQWANAEGLVTGRTETTIVPQGSTTRAETATILMRYLEKAAG